MSNTTYLASRRAGSRTNCAEGKRRISVTLTEEAFVALRDRADRNHRGISGEASELIHHGIRTLSGDCEA
jgi:hypothetical protein